MDRTRRNELETASALLHKIADGAEITADDSVKAVVAAAAVDAVLEPGGWTQLREAEGVFTTNLPITTRASVRDALKEAAKAKRKSLTALVTEGHREVLAGTWTPPQSRRVVRRGESAANDPRVVLNVTVEDALRQELRDRLPSLSDELGYKVTEGGIALAYLKHKLGITEETLAAQIVSEQGKEKQAPVSTSRPKRGRKPAAKRPDATEQPMTWTAHQCAAYRGTSRAQWLSDVEAGVEPKPVEVTSDGIELWDAAAVRAE